MEYTRKELETLISESNLFSLNREGSLYLREARKMTEYLYRYLQKSFGSRRTGEYGIPMEECGCEIVQTASDCIKSFDSSKGEFLHYFLAAWGRRYKVLCGDAAFEKQYAGTKFTEEEKREIRRYCRLVRSEDPGCPAEELYGRLAAAMQKTPEEVREIAAMSSFRVERDHPLKKDDGTEGEQSLLDLIPGGTSPEQDQEAAELLREKCCRIDSIFTHLQERQKKLISELLTAALLQELTVETVREYSFFSTELLEFCLEEERIPSQKEIGRRNGIQTEASVSRTWKSFREKLRAAGLGTEGDDRQEVYHGA